MALKASSERCAAVTPEPEEHRHAKGVAKESLHRQYSGALGHDEARRIDYSDPFVRALLSPAIIGRIKEILAEGDMPPLFLKQAFYFRPYCGIFEYF